MHIVRRILISTIRLMYSFNIVYSIHQRFGNNGVRLSDTEMRSKNLFFIPTVHEVMGKAESQMPGEICVYTRYCSVANDQHQHDVNNAYLLLLLRS